MTASRRNYAGHRLGDGGLIELLGSGQLAGCTELTLWDNRLGDRGAEALAWCEELAELRVLDLGWNQIGASSADAARRGSRRVTRS
jgi:Leucine Rich Repeat (LRR) protein